LITETTEHLDGLLDDLLRVTDGERASVLIGVIGADMFPRFRHAEAVLAVASIMAELAIRSPEPELVMALTLRLAHRVFKGLRGLPRGSTEETAH
jgi:hypothetical protein